MSLNVISIVGRLGKDPEIRTTQGGKNVASFSVAVTRSFGKGEDGKPLSDWFNVQAWGQTADYCGNFLAKGQKVSVSGTMENKKYTDKDGILRDSWQITANSVSSEGGVPDNKPAEASGAAAAPKPAATDAEYDPFSE